MKKKEKLAHRWFILAVEHLSNLKYVVAFGPSFTQCGGLTEAISYAVRERAEADAFEITATQPALIFKLRVVRRDVPREKPRRWKGVWV